MEGFLGVIVWIIIMIAAGVSKNKKAQQQKDNRSPQPQRRRTVSKPTPQSDPWADLRRMLGEEPEDIPQRSMPRTPQRDAEWYVGEGDSGGVEGMGDPAAASIEKKLSFPRVQTTSEPVPGVMGMVGVQEGECASQDLHRHGSKMESKLVLTEKSKTNNNPESGTNGLANLGDFSNESWAKAVILSEIIGQPVARRQKGYWQKSL